MKTAAEYRVQAHEACRERIGSLALVFFVYDLLVGAAGALSATGIGAIVLLFISGPLYLGFVKAIQNNLNGVDVKVENLFEEFDKVVKTFVVSLLQGVYLCLWSLLIIPIFVKPYSYAMTYYIHKDNKELGANECITKSRQMMDGNKWRLFCLEFSYIGWALLSMLTFGILLFWVVPRMETAKYQFYLDLKAKEEPKKEVEF